MTLRIMRIALERDADIVSARQRARRIAALLTLDTPAQTRLATAVSEIARNAIEHGGGGVAEFFIVGSTAPQLLEIRIIDHGPGIADITAIQAGEHRSAQGLGIGFVGAQRLVDRFNVESSPGKGTMISLGILLPDGAPLVDQHAVQNIADELARQNPGDATSELMRQNRELIESLDELRKQREALAIVNRELEDTNRGVVALYAELDEKAEHLRRADEIKTRFLSNMSHEFRTPLNSILALCRFLDERTDGPLTGEQERQVGFIRKCAESLSELVEDLLDLAKVAAGKTVVRPTSFDVTELFGALRGMLRPLLLSARVDLVFEPTDGLPTVFGDESKISQILRNFISNALKFTESGEVRVAASFDQTSEQLTLSVTDTGIGISGEHHDRIFEEFSQIDSPIQRRVKGTGLGLPLSKRLAELMGGTVALASIPGKGSTFSVTLPLNYRHAAEVPAEPILPDPERIPVLVVEDNPVDLAILADCLRGTSYQLIPASTLTEARGLVLSVHPKALLLDVMLGHEQCCKLLREIRGKPEMAHVPIIILSSVQDSAEAAALGADAWIEKPVDRPWLIAKLDELTTRRSKRILLVDDDEVARYVIRQYLADCDVAVTEASDGSTALDTVRDLQPDMVFLDLQMPGRDGFSVLAEMSVDPRMSSVPVTIVTSSAVTDEDRKRLLHAKAIVSKRDLSTSLLAGLLSADRKSEATR